jgi:hypothetical protein
MTFPEYPIDDAIASARGAAASLASIASALAEAVSEPAPTPSALRHVAHTLQAQAQRASLGAMSLAAHAGRLEAFAHAQAMDAAERERQEAAARNEVEAEAERDAALYLKDNAPNRPTLATWAADAFAGSWDGAWEYSLPVEREQAEAWHLAAFSAAVHRGRRD